MFDVEALLAPISGEAPCGADLEYDPEMQALEQAAAGKPERQVGDTVQPAQEPDWRDVATRSEALLARTKHLGVAAWLARSHLKQDGYRGAVAGLALLRGLVERYWDSVFPLLDPDDGSAVLRLNTLAPLTVGDDGGPRDMLREMSYAPLDTALGRAGLRVRDLTLAFGFAKAEGGEATPTPEAVRAALAGLLANRADLAQAMRDGHAHAQALRTLLEAKAPGEAPDLGPLAQLTQAVASAAGRALGDSGDAGGSGAGSSAGAAAPGARAVGAIRSREDAVAILEQVCEWFALNEPSHPAPLVIRRAQRLVKMNFLEIMRDLAPEGMRQVEDVIGREASS